VISGSGDLTKTDDLNQPCRHADSIRSQYLIQGILEVASGTLYIETTNVVMAP